jgi:3-oxoacyl-[acyl-carrier protein] reductase
VELNGQVALVTGASRGIGRAVALRLAQEGAAVAVNFRQQAEAAGALVAEIEAAGGKALAWQADVADAGACRNMVKGVADRFGRLDMLVNNAGTALEKLLMDTTDAEWDELMAIHLRGLFACTKAALPYMVWQRYGRIINISSIWGISGAAGEVAYSAAKAGQIGFTKALAKEVGAVGVTVNAVAPGAIDTEMNQHLTGPDLEAWLEQTPVGRLGTAQEIAEVVRFLALPSSSFITGQVWSPNGGVVI